MNIIIRFKYFVRYTIGFLITAALSVLGLFFGCIIGFVLGNLFNPVIGFLLMVVGGFFGLSIMFQSSKALMVSQRFICRPPDGQIDYKFELVTQPDGTHRAYILSQPGYNGRTADAHTTHRYYDTKRSLHYICIDPNPRSRSDMKTIARHWTNKTEIYRQTGKKF
jgi:hypothetical protein